MDTPDPAAPAPSRLQRLLALLARHRGALALASFAAGLGSFLLVRRGDGLAKVLAVLLLLSWLGLLLEPWLARRKLSPGLLRFLVQGIHQETFFFVLPFFFVTTSWGTPQALFTAALGLAALAAMWDPFYYGVIARRRPLFLVYHALSVFAAMLVALPILVHLTTAQSLALAAAAVTVLSVPGLALALDRQRPLHVVLLFAGSCALGAGLWLARTWVPPATLWVTEARITDRVDGATRVPGEALAMVAPDALHARGLYAFIAIHAPRELREPVYHRWLLDGREVDRIPLDIVGGREQGYRAWSYKQGFPADPVGQWRVEAITAGGQLIGALRFEVTGEGFDVAPIPQHPVPAPASAGEGQDGGVSNDVTEAERESAPTSPPVQDSPHPVPPPQAGEGTSAGSEGVSPAPAGEDAELSPAPSAPGSSSP